MSTPEFLGPYRIGKLLGRGGMGSVFEGKHEKSGDRVAVKLIAQHVSDEPKFRRRFAKEVETLKRLRHKGIVQLIGYGEEEGQLFYSMELVDGEPLQKIIKREKKLSWEYTIDLMIDVCSALKHAHDSGVVHRDLKPANLVVGEDEQVKLVDFGIAKLFDFGEQTMVGAIIGTADYMAPEQATSSGITVRTDLYALGSMMYAMLTGRPPFPGKRATEVIEALKRDRPVPLDLVDPHLPEDLVELVHQLLAKDPAERPPTALAVMNRLKAMRAGLQRSATVVLDAEPNDKTDVNQSHRATRIDQTTVSKLREGTGGARDTTKKKQTRVYLREDNAATDVTVDSLPSRQLEETNLSLNDQSLDLESDSIISVPSNSTHFQSVAEERELKQRDLLASESEQNRFSQLMSITGMIAVLAFGAYLFYFATRKPDSGELYEKILAAHADGDLFKAKDEIDLFIEQFPNDPRADFVRSLARSLDVHRAIRRLSVQAKLDITPLAASEQGFLDALTNREMDPTGAGERIAQWLAIYDNPTIHADEELLKLIKLARHERKQLTHRAPEIIIDVRAAELIDRIHTIVEKAPPEKAKSSIQGIINLHADQEWAIPAVKEARNALSAIENQIKDI